MFSQRHVKELRPSIMLISPWLLCLLHLSTPHLHLLTLELDGVCVAADVVGRLVKVDFVLRVVVQELP